jgi:hypothetical protein
MLFESYKFITLTPHSNWSFKYTQKVGCCHHNVYCIHIFNYPDLTVPYEQAANGQLLSTGDSLLGVLVGKKAPGQDRYEPLPIRALYLGHNNISSLEPDVLEHLQFLRDLHLDYNPITEVGQEFTQALQVLPELKVCLQP